nr:GNAT family N-acetyltransferase [uncultured Anaerostipes sp.]
MEREYFLTTDRIGFSDERLNTDLDDSAEEQSAGRNAVLYIHGKGGSHLEAEQYRKNCPGFDIIGVDYEVDVPWIVEDKIRQVYDEAEKKYQHIDVIASSIGAYFAMHSLQKKHIEKALFISPIVDMEKLILDMMNWAGVSEEELAGKGEIPTDFGETLSWEYLCFVRENPICWNVPTEILYGGKDNLTSRKTIEQFTDCHNVRLTVMEDTEYKPGWERDIYPTQEFLVHSIEKGNLYIGRVNEYIAACMVVNHEYNDGYHNARWSVNVKDSELFVIHALGVHPAYSGKGIAKQMVQKVINTAREQKIKTIRLDVLEGNIPAEQVYTQMGFVYCSTIKMFYEDTGWTNYRLFEYIVN